MKLQLALDGNLAQSLHIFAQVQPFIDIAELGTPLIYREGVGVAAHFRALHPATPLTADFKIMDAGEEEAGIAFEAGCDYVTVLGITQDVTVQGAVRAARHYGKQVIADMLQVEALIPRAAQLLAMGCDYLCVHTAHDLQASQSPFAALQNLRAALPDAPLAVAGGITPHTIARVLPLQPQIVIVGSAITQTADPIKTAQALREKINSA